MTRDHVAMLREGIHAWNGGDIETILEMLDPDVSIRISGAFAGLGPEFHGHQGFRDFWREMRQMWDPLELDAVDVEPLDGQMLTTVRFRGTGRDGIHVERDFYFLWEFDEAGEKVVRYRSYLERDDAEAAAREGIQKGGLRS